MPRNPKNGASANARKSEKRSSTSRHSSCQRSGGSPGHQYSHAQSWLHSILPPRQYPPQNNPNRFRAMLPGRTLQRIGRKYHRASGYSKPMPPCEDSATEPSKPAYHLGLWRYTSLQLANTATSTGGVLSLPAPVLPTEFELRVKQLQLTPEMYASSRELRLWCQLNRNRCYVPEWLLGEWGITVSSNLFPSTQISRS